jgi:hypothetical protein
MKMSNTRNIRSILAKKLLTTCPVCGKKIYGRDIDIDKINKDHISNWPVRYTHCHSHEGMPTHALTMYLDANFAVRGRESSEFLKIT